MKVVNWKFNKRRKTCSADRSRQSNTGEPVLNREADMPVFVGELFRAGKLVAHCQVWRDAAGAIHVQDVEPQLPGGRYQLRSSSLIWEVQNIKGEWKEIPT